MFLRVLVLRLINSFINYPLTIIAIIIIVIIIIIIIILFNLKKYVHNLQKYLK